MPFAAGVKRTPTEQLAPAARVAEQVFCVKLNGAEAVRDSCAAVTSPELVIVATCVALGWPSSGWRKLIWEGVITSFELPCPMPVRLTWAEETPGVDEERTNVAASWPTCEGVNVS